MNFTYLLLDIAFGGVSLLLVRRGLTQIMARPVFITLWLVSALTLVFDNLIVYFDIVAYEPVKNLGVAVPFAPIEDFGYTIIGAFLIPAIWHLTAKLGIKKSTKAGDE